MLEEYRKTITPALIAAVGVLGTYIANGELDRVSLAVAVVGALQVTASFFVTNVPGYEFAKALVGALAGTIVAVGTLIEQGEWSRETTAAAVTAVVLAVVTYGVSNGGSTNELGSFDSGVVAGPGQPPEGAIGGKYGERR
jgi:hypothetical protein